MPRLVQRSEVREEVQLSKQIIMSSQSPQMDGLNSILKLVRQRQDNFFRLLEFVTGNLDSEHQQQLTITHNFLQQLQAREISIVQQEQALLAQNTDCRAQPKLASRLCARLLELYENSLLRIRNSCFDNDKATSDYKRFAENLNSLVVQSESVPVCSLFSTVFEYSKAKQTVQVRILSEFVDKLDSGQDVLLRDLYSKYKEANSLSNSQCKAKRKSPKKSERSMRDPSKTKEKRDSSKGKSSERSDSCGIVSKMMKLYSVLDPSRVQFAEDLIYEEKTAEQHKNSLMANLIEKNKMIGDQIANFMKTIEPIRGKTLVLPESPKTDNQAQTGPVPRTRHNRASNFKSQSQIKANLKLIAEKGKRRQDGQVYDGSSGGQYHSDTCQNASEVNALAAAKRPKTLMKQKKVFPDLSKTLKAKQIDSQKRPTSSNKSNRVFVVKAPTVFEDEGLVSRSASNRKKTSKDSLRRKSSKKINRSLISRQYKAPPRQDGTPQNPSIGPELEAPRVGTGRRQFNLRLKKQVKKSIITTQLEQANEQIGSYIFPE